MRLAKIYPYTKFEDSSFTRSIRFTEGGLKFNYRPLDPNHALLGGILSCLRCEMGLAKFYPCTEFEVSTFIRSKFTEGGKKFKNSTLDPDHAPF